MGGTGQVVEEGESFNNDFNDGLDDSFRSDTKHIDNYKEEVGD